MLKHRRSAAVRSILPALLLMSLLLPGCSIPQKHAATPDCAFIDYWPPAENDKRLHLAVKDLIDMKGVVTTAGSEFLAKHSPPARRDAKCLALARASNVSIVGKTNLSELAVGVSGINQYFGTPVNPVSKKRNLIPGGSSSGSAVAVANGTADVSFGTDTVGSVRVPAACCGVLGLKTTFGLIPLDGVYPIAPSYLDTVGPMARDVPHLVHGMELLQRDFTARYQKAGAQRPSAKGIRIGRLYIDGTDPRIDKAIDAALASKGFQVVPMSQDFKTRWLQAENDGKTVATSSAWLYDQQFKDQPEIKTRTRAVVAIGAYQYYTNFRGALTRQARWRRELDQAFKEVDFIALPTLKTLPPHIPLLGGTPAFELLMVGRQNTAAVNFAGNPALALPIPIDDKVVPVTSLQLVGPRLSEAQLINAGRLIESDRR